MNSSLESDCTGMGERNNVSAPVSFSSSSGVSRLMAISLSAVGRSSILCSPSKQVNWALQHCGGGVVRKVLIAGLLALLSLASSLAQGFPERPVRIIVPLPPGGSPDTIARSLALSLQGVWSQPVVVENRTGGSQNIGADVVAKSPPDGHTWLIAPDNVFAVNPHVGKQEFDPLADLAPVTLLARIQFLLVVHPSVPAASVQELIAHAKAKPGELNHGSSGNGSPQHLGAALLQQLAGIRMNHVPYKGAAHALADLLPGRIQVWIGAANSLLPHVKEGKLRLLGSTAPQRFANLGAVPTVAEAGVPGYALDPWLGLFVPGQVAPEIVMRINAEVTKVVNAPELKSRLAAQGIDIATNSPADFSRMIRDDHARWGKIIRQAGMKGE
ncbi:MAG: tripartite tricarboxylate transporter substrate binding protein [Betaproteobacteria bacterium]|nr:tripartite tricarboxylate transporter substrate binding protein [Betaproteobacteria bacterium]